MTTLSPVIIADVLGYGLFLWLGLYLLIRAPLRTAVIRTVLAGLFCQALFFLAATLTDAASDATSAMQIERWSWWTAVLPMAIWYHISLLISRPIHSPAKNHMALPIPALLAYGAGLIIAAVGTVSDLFNNYELLSFGIQPGPLYLFYIVFQAAMTLGALSHFIRARSALFRSATPPNRALLRQITLLAGGSALFAVGALWLAVRFFWSVQVSALPGYVCLFGALALLGYAVAHYGMLMGGRNIQRDFFYTFSGVALMNVVYALLIALVGGLNAIGLLILVTLVTLTHTAFDSGRTLLDRLFFSLDEQLARAEARDFATALGIEAIAPPMAYLPPLPAVAEPNGDTEDEITQPLSDDSADDGDDTARLKAFKSDVRKALTGLKNPPRLVNSPLLSLDVVTAQLDVDGLPDNRLNRVGALREVLIERMEGLRPVGAESAKTGDAWRFYNVLHYPYVREFSRKGALAEARRLRQERLRNGVGEPSELEQVLEWLADVDEDTFYKWQRRASDTIAEALWDEIHPVA